VRIPMSSPDVTAAEIAAVKRVLQTRYLSTAPRIAEFEERFVAYVRAYHQSLRQGWSLLSTSLSV